MNLEEAGFRNFRFRSRDLAPTESERLFLRQRGEQLDAWLQPVSLRVLDVELTALFSTMAFRSGDEKDLTLVNRIYRDDLAGVPGFALTQACARFRKAEIGDGKFVPKQGELRKEAMRIAQPFFEERTRVSAVMNAALPAELPNAERRKQIVAECKQMMRDAAARAILPNEIGRSDYKPPPPEPPKSELQKLDELSERLRDSPAPPLSDAALGMFHGKQGVAAE